MNALAMPISSRTAEDMSSACFCTNSPRILEERAATDWHTFASSSVSILLNCCISHDTIIAQGALCAGGIVQIVQVGYRLAHREERLVRVERPAEQHAEQLGRASGFFFQRIQNVPESGLVVLLELLHTSMRAVEGLAVRRQDQHVLGQLPVARD